MKKSEIYLMLIMQKCRQLQQMLQTSWQSKKNYEQINKMYCLYLLKEEKNLLNEDSG